MAKRKTKRKPTRELRELKNVLIVDVETTGLVAGVDRIIELGFVLWNVTHSSIVTCGSCVVGAEENPVEHINRIPVGLLKTVAPEPSEGVLGAFESAAVEADAFVAHNAAFECGFIFKDTETILDIPKRLPWICTMNDFPWPYSAGSKGIVAIVLAHGVGVSVAHRALSDCLLIAHAFERLPDIANRLKTAHARAIADKFNYSADVSYQNRGLAKDAGFHWEGERKLWIREMTEEDEKDLDVPFPITRQEEAERPPWREARIVAKSKGKS